MKYIVPKTESGIRKKLKGFEPKNKEELIYYIQLNLASINLEMNKLADFTEPHIVELRGRYGLLKDHWDKRLVKISEMSDEEVKNKLA